MSKIEATRNPPRLVLVPPPAGPGMPRKRITNIAGASVVGSVVSLAFFVGGGLSLGAWAATMGGVLAGVAVVVVVWYHRVNRAYQALRRAFLEKHPGVEHQPLVGSLGKAWKENDRVPKVADVREGLPEDPEEDAMGRAWVISFGEPDVPEVGDLHFEPEIVTPTGAVWRQLIWLLIAGAVVAWWALDYLQILPRWLPGVRPLLGGFAYFLVAGALALAVWIWKGMIRPTYLRMAPGIIQVLEYHYLRSKPGIRSYPMEPGTLAFFTRVGRRTVLTLSRGDHKDVLAFSRMQQPKQRIEQAWQALLSTAPKPPLSDEELLG